MQNMKKIFLLIIALTILLEMNMKAYANNMETESEEKKTICFIYDNSVSMRTDDLNMQEQYAVKMFCAMSDWKDEIRFYCVGDFDVPDSEYDVEKDADRTQFIKNEINEENEWTEYFDEINKIGFEGQNTYLSGILKAIEDVKNEQGEKWIVMFTDGGIEKAHSQLYESLKEIKDLNKKVGDALAGTGVNLYFSSLISEDSDSNNNSIESNEEVGIYTSEGVGSVLDCILSATEVIYGKRRLEDNGLIIENPFADNLEYKEISVNFDLPVSSIVLLLQNEREPIGEVDLTGCKWNMDICAKTDEGEKPPYGIIAEYEIGSGEYEEKDNYNFSVAIPNNIDNYTIYYTPVGEASLRIQQNKAGIKEGSFIEGEYQIYAEWLNPQTKKPIETASALLQRETCKLMIDGKPKGMQWGEEINEVAENGEIEIALQTSLGDDSKKIIFEKDMENYDLHVDGEKEIFYYNRLEKREKYISVEIWGNGENITKEWAEEELEIKFFQNGKENTEIKGEAIFDPQLNQWKVYPVLVNPKNESISGNFRCELSVSIEADWYKEPIEYRTETDLTMGLEEGLLQVKIPEDMFRMGYICPFIGNKVELDYEWNEEKIKARDLKKVEIAWEIFDEEGSVEKKENKSENSRIYWNLLYLLKEPKEIKLAVHVEKDAYGELQIADDEREIPLKDMQNWVKYGCYIVILALIVCVLVVLYHVIEFLVALIRKRRKLFCPKIYRSAMDIWVLGKVKWEWKGFAKGCYLMTISLPFYHKDTELKMEVYYKNGKYRMTVKSNLQKEIEMRKGGKEKIDLKNQEIEVDKEIEIRVKGGNKICGMKIEER